MDEELKQLDLAIAEARRLASEALAALREPQAALRAAAADYIESVARSGVDASRRASVEVMAKLSDEDVVELRFWVDEQATHMRTQVEEEIESCDFWIPDSSGMSLSDVNTYGAALVPRAKDSASGIPQALIVLFERCLHPLRRGLAVVGLAVPTPEADRALEVAVVRAWRTYREVAVQCLTNWVDVDERYRASSARFQEMRWELAEQADVSALKTRQTSDEPDLLEPGIIAEAAAAAAATAIADAELEPDEPLPDEPEPVPVGAVVRADSETLLPVAG